MIDTANFMESIAPFSHALRLIGISIIVLSTLFILFKLVSFNGSRVNWGSTTIQLFFGTMLIGHTSTIPFILEMANWLGFWMGGPRPGSEESKTTPEPEPAVAEPVTSAPADLSWIPVVLAITGVVVATVVVGIGVVHYYRKSIAPSRAKTLADAATADKLVKEGRDILKWVLLESASYETDLAKQIDYPIMTDVSEPLVSAYVKEMHQMQILERSLAAKPLLADAQNFMNLATGLKVSFEAAVAKAERVRWSNFTVAEKKRLKDARTALRMVQDSSTTPEQRNAQYKRIAKLLDGLITLTTPVKQSLAAWVPMLALETGKTAVETGVPTTKVPVAAV